MSIWHFRLNYSLKFKAVLPCIMSHLSTGLLPTSDCSKTLMSKYIHVFTPYPFQLSYSIKKIEAKNLCKIWCSTQQILWVISPWKFSLVVRILGIFHLLWEIMQEYSTFHLFPLSTHIIIPAAITSAWTCKWKIPVPLKSDKNNGCFTWIPVHTYGIIVLKSWWYRGMFHRKVVEKIKTHILCSITFFLKIVPFM